MPTATRAASNTKSQAKLAVVTDAGSIGSEDFGSTYGWSMFDQALAQVERPKDIRTWIERELYRAHYDRERD
jgi:hypothetical protein